MNSVRLSLLFLLICVFSGSAPGQAQERRVQPGDVLQVTVIGRPDLSRTVIVSPNGTIAFPFLGEERVTGYSLRELRLIITARLSQYIEGGRPAVDVTWGEEVKGNKVTVTVLGLVGTPGVVTVASESGVQTAINAAGGTKPGARKREIKLRRMTKNGPTEIIIDLEKFIETGDLGYIPPLQEGDIIIIPGGTTAGSVKVLGAVNKPGTYEPTAGATVFDMIIEAGGASRDARIGSIRLIKPTTGVTEEYAIDLTDYLKTGKQSYSPPVDPGDIIIVPTKLISYGRVLDFARDITVLLSLFYLYRIILQR